MADENKVIMNSAETEEKATNKNSEAAIIPEKKTTARKYTSRKTAANKTGEEKTEKSAVKSASKRGGKTTKKQPKTEAAVKKEKSVRTRKKTEPSLDMATTALWNKFKDADVSGIQDAIAVQIVIYDMGTFFIAIKDGGEKHIIQAVYNDRDGTLETSYEEILKIAAGGYDYLTAINNGTMNYQGDLKKAIIIAELFK